MHEEVQLNCLNAMQDSDREKAIEIVEEWAMINGYENIFVDILEPVLEKLGDLWTVQKDVSFAQVYVSATIAEEIILRTLEHQVVEKKTESKGTVVLGNIEDDYHSLGRRLVGIFISTAGWNVIDLGNDVTASEFVDKAIEHKASVIAVSAMMYTTAQNIRKVRTEIDNRGYQGKIMLAVGGAVFNLRQDFWKEVGADGMSRNAIDASRLLEELTARQVRYDE